VYRHRVDEDVTITGHGFIIHVEVEDGVSPESISEKLAGALTFVEGVGPVDVTYLGEIELVDDSEGTA